MLRLTRSLFNTNQLVKDCTARFLYNQPVQRLRFRQAPVLGTMLHNYFGFGKTHFTFEISALHGECHKDDNKFTLSESSNNLLNWLHRQKFHVGEVEQVTGKQLIGFEFTERDSHHFSNNLQFASEDLKEYIAKNNIKYETDADRKQYLVKEQDGRRDRLSVPYPAAIVNVKITDETTVNTDELTKLDKQIKAEDMKFHDFWAQEFYPDIVKMYGNK
jgi:hypothetical protein